MKKTRNYVKAIGLSMALVMTNAAVLPVAQFPVYAEAYARKTTVENRITFVGDTMVLDAGKGKVTWSTSNKKLATVTQKGKVKALAAGNVRITAKTSKSTIVFKLTIRKASEKVKITHHFADVEEGIKCKLSNEKYFNRLTQDDLDFRAQKKDATLEEFKTFSAAQVKAFTEEEKKFIAKALKGMETLMNKKGYKIPVKKDIVFVKTTMADEGGAMAYTHQNQIYLHEDFLKAYQGYDLYFQEILCHELFHCLTRQNKNFKKKMYSVINAQVMDKEAEFPEEVAKKVLANPDVESFDSYVTLTINGEKKKCVVFPYCVRGFEKEGDNFFDAIEVKLMPIDDTSKLYSIEEATDFWDVFGKNTNYILAIEETMADNFAYAVIYDEKIQKKFPNPEIFKKIQKKLCE